MREWLKKHSITINRSFWHSPSAVLIVHALQCASTWTKWHDGFKNMKIVFRLRSPMCSLPRMSTSRKVRSKKRLRLQKDSASQKRERLAYQRVNDSWPQVECWSDVSRLNL